MKAYRCSHSGLLLPPDYKEMWGILYGHGLGTEPVSECLDSDVRVKIDLTRAQYTCDPSDFMFPFHTTHAKVELVDVSEEEYNDPDNRLIMAVDDRSFARRAAILREKQAAKPEFAKVKIAAGLSPYAKSDRKAWR